MRTLGKGVEITFSIAKGKLLETEPPKKQTKNTAPFPLLFYGGKNTASSVRLRTGLSRAVILLNSRPRPAFKSTLRCSRQLTWVLLLSGMNMHGREPQVCQAAGGPSGSAGAHAHARPAQGFRRRQRKEQPGSLPPGSGPASPSPLDAWATPGRGGPGGWRGAWGRAES